MSLIRCLGRVALPLSYRRFMARELQEYKSLRKSRLDSDLFTQERVHDPLDLYVHNHSAKRYEDDPRIIVQKPVICPKLVLQLGAFLSGSQIHTCMTAVHMGLHRDDDAIGEHPTAMVIPYSLSDLHYLMVEDEVRQLIPGHVYAFNQRREHGLQYRGATGPRMSSKPCSILNVSFTSSDRRYR